MSKSPQDELAALHAQLADAQAHITALELASYRQQRQLDLFQGQLSKLYAMIKGPAADGGAELAADPRDDIPPHY